ncbi:UNVERIFIED_CONTAM: RNA polymerase II [Gekko kuhli]
MEKEGVLKSFRVVQPHQQQLFDEEEMPVSENEEAGPSKRKRQPSMSETMPLYTLCKEDLESMDKEDNTGRKINNGYYLPPPPKLA